jgi:dihydroxyacetone kinase-like predicted kinase
VDRLDGAAVRGWAAAAATLLGLAAPRIDAVNVFPVPDCDTGTNVRLTVEGGARRARAVPAGAPAAQVARAFAAGALTAARGNSGVIVSQYLTGFAAALSDEDTAVSLGGGHANPAPSDEGADAAALATALDAAAAASRGAVAAPEEGTVLTVARLVGERARHAARTGATLAGLLGPVLDEARGELARISAEHPVLRGAHVVDAGACALLVVLEALERTLAGTPGPLAVPAWLPAAGADPDAAAAWRATEPGGVYEVMLLVRPDEPDPALGDRLRAALAGVGDSVAVVGVDDLWHVHVHTDDPAAAIAAARLGARSQVVVRLVEGAAAQVAAGDEPGLVVATGEPGIARFFGAGGAVVVVRCPEAPVTAGHLARAAADTGATRVVVLPGAPDLAEAAGGLAADDELAGVAVDVLGTVDVLAAAVAALAVLGAGGDAATRAEHARAALGRLRTTDVAAAGGLEPATEELVGGAAGAAQAVTVQHTAAAYGEAVALREHLAAVHPDLDVVLVGPVEAGPPWRIGVD